MKAEPAGRFERFERIGSGAYGEVFRGWDHVRGHDVALKIVKLDDMPDDLDSVQKEVALLSGCRCENIVRYFASVLLPGSSQLTIAMELLPASAVDLMANEGRLWAEDAIAWIMRGTVSALAYLHDQARMHRDLKAANVLLSAEGGVKLSDFGVAGALTGTLGFQRATFVGTPYWMAPEVIEAAEQGSYGPPADIWSAGITAIELATGAPPLAELHPMRALFCIPKSTPPRLPSQGHHSPSLASFVEACLQFEPSMRPSASELLHHPFIANASLPADLPSQIACAAQECSRAAQHAAGQVPQGVSSQPVDSNPEWAYSASSSRLMDGSNKSRVADLSYPGSVRVYIDDDAVASLDGGVSDYPTSAQPSADSFPKEPALDKYQSTQNSGSLSPTNHPAAVLRDWSLADDDASGHPPPSGYDARSSVHRPLSGWANPRDHLSCSPGPTRGSGTRGSGFRSDDGEIGGRVGGQQPPQNPPILQDFARDAAQVVKSLEQANDPVLAPFTEAASNLFGGLDNLIADESLPNLGPLGQALLSQVHRGSKQLIQATL